LKTGAPLREAEKVGGVFDHLPGEIGECYAGMRPGPDDPPRRSSQVIEGKANPPQPQARKPFVNGLSDVPQHVRDTRPPNEAWRNVVKIDWQG
jgi:hypothetical protein